MSGKCGGVWHLGMFIEQPNPYESVGHVVTLPWFVEGGGVVSCLIPTVGVCCYILFPVT
jgi:hypothetical protein